MSKFNRRQLLKLSTTGAVLIGAPSILRAQSGEVRIGGVFASQGSFAANGEACMLGIRAALAQVDNKVLGRPIKFIRYDEPTPLESQQNTTKLIQEDKVSVVLGSTNSATGLAIASVGAKLKVPTIITSAQAVDITGKNCDKNVFRVNAIVNAYARLLSRHLLTIGKKWYFVSGAYAYGQGAYAQLKKDLDAAGGTEVGSDFTPTGATDFSSIILKIRQTNPDVVALATGGADTAAFLKQFTEFGLRTKIPVGVVSVNDDELWAQTDPTGIVGKYWHFNNPANSPDEKNMNEFVLKESGHPAAASSALGWISMRMLVAAIEQEKSLEPAAIIHGLETVRPQGVPGYFRDWDHQFITRLVLGKIRDKVTDKYDPLTIVSTPATVAEAESLYDTKAQSECRMAAT